MDACAQKRLNRALKECICHSIVPSRASLYLRVVFLFTRNHILRCGGKKSLFADGDFCVVKKAGKEMDGA